MVAPASRNFSQHRLERAGLRAAHGDIAAGGGHRCEKRPGLDPVGHDRVCCTMQARHTFHRDPVGARAGNACAHGAQAAREVDDFRFVRGVFQDRRAFGKSRRHQQVFSSGDGRHVEDDGRAAQAPRGIDVAVLEVDRRAHRLQALHVLVDGAQADRAAARQRHARLAAAREQWPQRKDRRAHRLHQFVGRQRPVDPAGVERHACRACAYRAPRPSAPAAFPSCPRRSAAARS